MILSEYATTLRRGDWTAPFSDSASVWRRHNEWMDEMKKLSQISKNHSRLWELAREFEAKFTWWVSDDDPDREEKIETRFEAGWRWAGAYLWAHGIRLSPEQAQALVGARGRVDTGECYRCEMTGRPDWETIGNMIDGVQ